MESCPIILISVTKKIMEIFDVPDVQLQLTAEVLVSEDELNWAGGVCKICFRDIFDEGSRYQVVKLCW